MNICDSFYKIIMAFTIFQTGIPPDACPDYTLYFLRILERDLQSVFDKVLETHKNVKTLLRKSTVSSKGDFCIPLKCVAIIHFEGLKSTLFDDLKSIQYISKINIDEQKYFYIHLNKSIVYSYILNQVEKQKEKYGVMETLNSLYFIIVHSLRIKNCLQYRIVLLAELLTSFLLFNGFKVITTGPHRNSEIALNNSTLCTHECVDNISMVSELLINSAKKCEWRENIVDKNDSICINGDKYIKTYPSLSRFGNNLGIIRIESESKVLQNSARTLHFFMSHDITCDNILHVCAENEKHNVIQSGCLNQILGVANSYEYCINCKDVCFKSPDEMTMESFLHYIKGDILKSVSHRHTSGMPEDEMLDILLDTSAKFMFLSTAANAALKIYSYDDALKKNDGIFVQYNFARLCKLLQTFEIKVQKGYYKKLPNLDEIDFELLQEKEEWDLLKFIMFFPQQIEDIFYSINSEKHFLSNSIFIMLRNLSHSFSKYYRRVRILTSPQLQLQKVMHARIWLLKGIHQVMYNSFAIINVKGLNYM